MRRLSLTAFLAVPLLLVSSDTLLAHPPGTANFGCAGHCLKMFPFIHQHGPLFNYGPYYGYYPFAPYGPWDAYLRYDPYWAGAGAGGGGDMYGLNPRLRGLGAALHGHGLGCGLCGLFHGHGHGHCFHHASWLHGGWFRGHKWLDGGHGCGHSRGHGCKSCGGVAVVEPAPTPDPVVRYSGVGNPAQSAVFYAATPTLDPVLDLVPTAGTN
jgi:hypothetical protein